MVRRVAIGLVVTLVAAACGGADPLLVTTEAVSTTSIAPPASAVPPDYVILDEDPAGPVSLTVGFADDPNWVTSAVFFSDEAGGPPSEILFTFAGAGQAGGTAAPRGGRVPRGGGAEGRVTGAQCC